MSRPQEIVDELNATDRKEVQKELKGVFRRKWDRAVKELSSADRHLHESCHPVQPAPRAPPLTPPKEYHFFICHHQGSGGDQAHLLCDALRSRGYKVWYDNVVQSDARNLGGMQRGVRSSACLLLLLSGRKENAAGVPDSSGVYEGPFTRPYCHQETATARSERLPVIGVMEVDERYNKADLAEEKRRARTGGANGGPISEHAEDILALLDGSNSVVFLPFRRQQHDGGDAGGDLLAVCFESSLTRRRLATRHGIAIKAAESVESAAGLRCE